MDAEVPTMPAMGTKWLPELDGLRAISILAVFVEHVALHKYFQGGRVGVDVFFTLSGFLITRLLVAEGLEGRIRMGQFYLRRVLRLVPAMVAMVLVVWPLSLTLFARPEWPTAAMHWAALGTLAYFNCWPAAFAHELGPFGHTWSLSVEECFYLVWPAFIAVAMRTKDRARLLRWVVGALVVTGGWSLAAPFVAPPDWVYYSPDARAVQLITGALLAVGFDRLSARWAAPSLIFGLAGLLTIFFLGYHSEWPGFLAFVGVATAAVVFGVLSRPGGVSARVLRSLPLTWLGRRSYAFYLWHVPVVLFFSPPVEGKLLVLAVVLAQFVASIVLMQLSWVVVERPFLSLKKSRGGSPG